MLYRKTSLTPWTLFFSNRTENKLGQAKHICFAFPGKNIFQWSRDCVLRRIVQKFLPNVIIQGTSEQQVLSVLYRIYTKYTNSLDGTSTVAMKIVVNCSTSSGSWHNPTLKQYISTVVHIHRFTTIMPLLMFAKTLFENHNFCFVFIYFHTHLNTAVSHIIWLFFSPLGVVARRVTSTANNWMNNSMRPDNIWTPCLPVLWICSASWLINRQNNIGLSTHPCLTPFGHSKKSVYSFFTLTQDNKELYISFMALANLPDTPSFCNVSSNLQCFTESNASRKSTKATYFFALRYSRCFWTMAFKTKIWTTVE